MGIAHSLAPKAHHKQSIFLYLVLSEIFDNWDADKPLPPINLLSQNAALLQGIEMNKILIVLTGFLFVVSGSAMHQERASSASVQNDIIYLSNVMGAITIPADTLTISVIVQSTNDNGTTASMKNAAAMDKITEALIDLGIDKDDISSGQLTGVSTGQSSNVVCNTVNNKTICRTESSSKNVLTSTKSVKIRPNDPSFVNKVLDTVNSLGANFSVLGYSLIDQDSAKAKAKDKAMENAESIAQNMASQRGADLGSIQGLVVCREYIIGSDQLGMVDVTSVIDVSYALI